MPPDADGDHTSDLNDSDDDSDGIPDEIDPFPLDRFNGLATRLPISYLWENDGSNPGGILNLGFTGLMINGASNYRTLYKPNEMTAGGAAGVLTVDKASEGDAFGSLNNQEYGFQFGVWARPADTGPFLVHTRILGPFSGLTPADGQSMGLFVGAGDQDNYAKIVVSGTGGGQIAFHTEVGGAVGSVISTPLALPGPSYIDLYLRVDPTGGTIQPYTRSGPAVSRVRKQRWRARRVFRATGSRIRRRVWRSASSRRPVDPAWSSPRPGTSFGRSPTRPVRVPRSCTGSMLVDPP